MATDPKQLVVKATKTRLGLVYRIVIDGKVVVTTGDRCHASSDAQAFHRRKMPAGRGYWYGLNFGVQRDDDGGDDHRYASGYE